jgi:hypothetical protein
MFSPNPLHPGARRPPRVRHTTCAYCSTDEDNNPDNSDSPSTRMREPPNPIPYLDSLLVAPGNTDASTKLLYILKTNSIRLDSGLGLKLLDLASALRIDGEHGQPRKGPNAAIERIEDRLNDFAGMLNVIAEAVGVNLLEDETIPVRVLANQAVPPYSRVTEPATTQGSAEAAAVERLETNAVGGGGGIARAPTLAELRDSAEVIAGAETSVGTSVEAVEGDEARDASSGRVSTIDITVGGHQQVSSLRAMRNGYTASGAPSGAVNHSAPAGSLTVGTGFYAAVSRINGCTCTC